MEVIPARIKLSTRTYKFYLFSECFSKTQRMLTLYKCSVSAASFYYPSKKAALNLNLYFFNFFQSHLTYFRQKEKKRFIFIKQVWYDMVTVKSEGCYRCWLKRNEMLLCIESIWDQTVLSVYFMHRTWNCFICIG